MAKILATCISEQKGTVKHPVEEILLQTGYGIPGDAHAGNWHRQVSLLAKESVRKMEETLSASLPPGIFAENILTEGLNLAILPVGTRLRIGNAMLEITQIGKECHADCAIRRQTGDCVMPLEGVFARVLQDGTVRAGDSIFPED